MLTRFRLFISCSETMLKLNVIGEILYLGPLHLAQLLLRSAYRLEKEHESWKSQPLFTVIEFSEMSEKRASLRQVRRIS